MAEKLRNPEHYALGIAGDLGLIDVGKPELAEATETVRYMIRLAKLEERADVIAWLRTAQALHDRARTGARRKRERDDAEVSHHYIKAAADSVEEAQHIGAAEKYKKE